MKTKRVKKLITILGILLVVLLSMMSTQVYAININAAQDAPTDQGHPNSNYNQYVNALDYELWTGVWNANPDQNSRSYLDFGLSGITNIGQATLWLYNGLDSHGASTFAPADVSVHSALAAWDETTITWNNQPGLGSAVDTTTVNTDIGWYSWDVTSLAQSNENSTLSLGLSSSGVGHAYYASETSSGNAPYLQVSVVPEPISTTLFIVGAATLGFRRFQKNKVAV